MTEPTRDQMLALCKRAGVTSMEIMDSPEYGLSVSIGGICKLAALVPGALRRGRLMEELAKIDAADPEVVTS
jgi:hypothetical protein